MTPIHILSIIGAILCIPLIVFVIAAVGEKSFRAACFAFFVALSLVLLAAGGIFSLYYAVDGYRYDQPKPLQAERQ